MTDSIDKTILITLVTQMMDPSIDDEERTELLARLNALVPHPEVAGLIFWPQRYGLGKTPKPEEIVKLALSYKPIQL